MDIGKLLGGLKGKVLDAGHFELLKHAYDLQEQNVTQLKSNNAALKESNELLKEKAGNYLEELEFLKKENDRLSKLVKSLNKEVENEPIVLSDNAIKLLQRIIQEDVTDFYQNAIVDVMDLSRIEVEAALDEMSEKGLISSMSARRGYGLHYHLTSTAKKALAQTS